MINLSALHVEYAVISHTAHYGESEVNPRFAELIFQSLWRAGHHALFVVYFRGKEVSRKETQD